MKGYICEHLTVVKHTAVWDTSDIIYTSIIMNLEFVIVKTEEQIRVHVVVFLF